VLCGKVAHNILVSLDRTMGIDELFKIATTRAPEGDEIAACCVALGSDVECALNSIALALAQRYDSGLMDFAACDSMVNALHGWCLLSRHCILPEPTYQVFLAFNEGEYHHNKDPHDVDPESKYTRPMIKAVLRGRDVV
jgi:hypothetical protein